MKHYRHIFFDLDHTLWDFETNAYKSLETLYHQLDLKGKGIEDFDLFYNQYSEYNELLWDKFRKGEVRREVLRWKRFAQAFLLYKITDESLIQRISEEFLILLPQQTQLFDGALETLDYLQGQGYKMHMITNGFESTQLLKIKHSGLAPYFTHIITSEQAMALKPSPLIYRYALNLSGASIEESIMIGDNYPVDIQGAIDIGMDTIWYHPHGDEQHKATHHITRLLSITDIL